MSTDTSPGAGQVSDATVDGVSGAVGSVIALLATYPLKTIYTLQALETGKANAALGVLGLVQRYGLGGLFVGIAPNIVESAASSGVYFYLYSRLRDAAVRHRAKGTLVQGAADGGGLPASSKDISLSLLASLLVPAIAGIGNQLVTMPLSVVATRMQALKKARMEGLTSKSASVSAVVREVYAESGLGGFWAGLVPSLVLICNPAIQFMLYEQLLRAIKAWKRHRLQAKRQAATACMAPTANGAPSANGLSGDVAAVHEAEEQPTVTPLPLVRCSAAETFIASALSKVGATLATYWLVVVKSRMQAQSKSASAELQYKGTVDALIRIWHDEGVGGFFKGLRAKILQTALNAALMLMLKEQVYLMTRQVLARPDLLKLQMQHLIKI